MQTELSKRLRLEYPIIQAGMVWTSGWKLAAACANAGALGLIGAGSMKPELLREHIRMAMKTESAFRIGVNIPLMRGDVESLIRVTIEEGIKIVFTSAGSPTVHTKTLKDADCFVAHVVASTSHAKKAQASGCDAVVAEGFEAGGHNGIDEITTMALVPQVVDAVKIPVIAAGGIADGRQMLAALSLGAEAVQIGTRFAATLESSAHERYKQAILDSNDSSTILTLKKVAPVRLKKNLFSLRALAAENAGVSRDEEIELLGRKREMRGIFEGDLDEGELEMGQSAGLITNILPASEVIRSLLNEYSTALERLDSLSRQT